MSIMTGRRRSWTIFFLSFIFTAALIFGPAATENIKASSDSVAPDFDLQNLNGSQVNLAQFKGKEPVLIYFWATWCHYCRSVRPEVAKMRQTIPESELEIIGINVGSGDSLEKVKRFEEHDPAPFMVLYDSDSKVTHSYRVEGIPHFVLIDKNGTIKYQGSSLPKDPMKLLQ